MAFAGRGWTAQTVRRVHGMEEVRGSIPLSSTQNRRSEACKGLASVSSALVNVANWLRWLRRDEQTTCAERGDRLAVGNVGVRTTPTVSPFDGVEFGLDAVSSEDDELVDKVEAAAPDFDVGVLCVDA